MLMAPDQVAPGRVTMASDQLGGGNNVGEQQGSQLALILLAGAGPETTSRRWSNTGTEASARLT
jgi:hypothetical protein